MKFKHTLLYHLLPIICIGICLVPLLMPYLHSEYFPSHDGEWAVVRLADMYRELRDGQFPARFSGNLNFGFGYPLFNFAYPLPYYAGIPFVLAHLGLVTSIKLLFVLSLILSVVCMYILSSQWWESKLAGLLSAVLYAYFPFRLVDLFVRGSLGETVAGIFFPFIFLCFFKIHKTERKLLWSILGGVGIALLILSHNIMAVLFLLTLLPIMVLLIKEKPDNLRFYALALGYGVLLPAFFLVPALLEKHLIALSQIPIADRSLYFVTLPQLLFSPWGYAPPTEAHGFTYQIGWPQIVVLLMCLLFAFHWGRKNNRVLLKHSALVLVGTVVVFVLMMFAFSAPLWQLPLLKEINYPWTLLFPIGFVISLLSGYLLKQSVWIKTVALSCGVLAIVLSIAWARPQAYIDRGDGFYLTNDATTTSSDELMPLWVKQKPIERKSKVEHPTRGQIELVQNTSKTTEFVATLSRTQTLQINTIYYPGWKVFIDNQLQHISYNNPQGVMRVSVPQGTHRVLATFSETPLRMVSDLISLLSLVSIPLVIFLLRRREKKV